MVREQPIDLGACESHLMAGDLFTTWFGTGDKWDQVMKLIGHLRWVDFLRLFNQGSRPFPTDVKKENVKIPIDKPTGDKTNDSDLTQMERIQLAVGIAKPIRKPRIQTNRLLLEWCCSDTSFFGMPSQDSKTCSVVRLTEREDMTTDDGYLFAQSAVNSSNTNNMVFIWSAIPFTGGPPWQHINTLFPGGEERIQGHLRIFKALFEETCYVC